MDIARIILILLIWREEKMQVKEGDKEDFTSMVNAK